ncbi:OmpA family protein [Flavobacterium sp. HSC-61S13]|uniref:OmpA family protein n=1 Tax=Flavobacterium sp. HSC-61S13 TaxID=2910963 RepID=UPI0020A0DA22|nr:OmpA family protein [Flavobacterium sp. HSC-61S13]MCP1995567.1 outer membrane protein OmpA-like peptidoglycan-associated protein/tetratricopeptide (TPR) repeat protein [Flavobacterium sp. HSC-61S13]
MKKTLLKWVFFALALTSWAAMAQDKKAVKGDKQYDRYEYIDAIKIYEHVAKKGHSSPELFQHLGNAYYFNGELTQANTWYKALFELTQEVPAEYYYRYAQTLKATQNYEAADRYLKEFAKRDQADQRAKLVVENPDYLKQIEANSNRYELNNLLINSMYSDYGSSIYNQHLIFTSARDTGSVSKKIHTWTNESFTSLYQAPILEDGTVGEVTKFAKTVNSKFNESTPVFSKDGNTMYFTRNNYNNGRRGIDSNKVTLLKIYRSQFIDEKWSDAEELSINSDNFSTAHPALSTDGMWLYFASDRAGGQGQSDLYKVAILANGSLGAVQNLSEINTGGRESFPFISAENELYFASDGRPGLGGLDIFVTKINADGSLGKVHNIGAPANSPYDDFAFQINTVNQRGFLSSNRVNGQGKDDIYALLETKKLALECIQLIQGVVYDKSSQAKLSHAKVVLYDSNFKILSETHTDIKGYYEFPALSCGTRYRVNAVIQDFNTAEVSVDLPLQSGVTQVDFGLEKTRVKVEKGDDLFKVLKLQPIYFDFDKSNIRPDAAVELAKVVEVLREYPTMKIDVRSHTDSRGKDAYNLKLSDRRAKSTIAWIVDQGIDKSRISGKGYGETQLINQCANGVKCSDEEHEQNRRSEFIVLEL